MLKNIKIFPVIRFILPIIGFTLLILGLLPLGYTLFQTLQFFQIVFKYQVSVDSYTQQEKIFKKTVPS
jgi:hypothetical protein